MFRLAPAPHAIPPEIPQPLIRQPQHRQPCDARNGAEHFAFESSQTAADIAGSSHRQTSRHGGAEALTATRASVRRYAWTSPKKDAETASQTSSHAARCAEPTRHASGWNQKDDRKQVPNGVPGHVARRTCDSSCVRIAVRLHSRCGVAHLFRQDYRRLPEAAKKRHAES